MTVENTKSVGTLSERVEALEETVAAIMAWPVAQQQTAISAHFKIEEDEQKRKRAERAEKRRQYEAAAPARNAHWQRFAASELVIDPKCQVPSSELWATFKEWADGQQLGENERYQKQDEVIVAVLQLGRIMEAPVKNHIGYFVAGIVGVKLVTPYTMKPVIDPTKYYRVDGAIPL